MYIQRVADELTICFYVKLVDKMFVKCMQKPPNPTLWQKFVTFVMSPAFEHLVVKVTGCLCMCPNTSEYL